MLFWSGYERSVRCGGPCLKLWVRRARCVSCRVSHALVPSFCLVGRLDVVEVIGEVIGTVVGPGRGVRPVAAALDVAHSTARDWVRRFVPGLWAFAGLLTGGRLLAVNTNPLWFVSGNRRFMPPVP